MNPIDHEDLETMPKNRMIGWFRLMVWCIPAFVIMAILIALGPVVYYLKIPESFFPFLLGGLSLAAVIALGRLRYHQQRQDITAIDKKEQRTQIMLFCVGQLFVIPIVGFVDAFAVGVWMRVLWTW